MTQTTNCQPPRASSGVWQKLNDFTQVVEDLLAVAQQRRNLRHLDDHMLKDIGMNRADVERETRRSFWDIANQKRR
jgi:uncharacterized protein YjiS (DUF1127 family)